MNGGKRVHLIEHLVGCEIDGQQATDSSSGRIDHPRLRRLKQICGQCQQHQEQRAEAAHGFAWGPRRHVRSEPANVTLKFPWACKPAQQCPGLLPHEWLTNGQFTIADFAQALNSLSGPFPPPCCTQATDPHRIARSQLPMARLDPEVGPADRHSSEPDIEAAVTTHQHRDAKLEGAPLTRGDPGASTSSSAPPLTPADATDAHELPPSALVADAPDQEGVAETVDGDIVRASAARALCRKNASLA